MPSPPRAALATGSLIVLALAWACASAPPPGPSTLPGSITDPTVLTWEEKLAWMMRLEDQRILRDPNPPPPAVLRPATRSQPALVAAAAPSDLIRLLDDEQARVRRRAALAIGRVGLSDGVQPLTRLLSDGEVEVRQMAVFALGLIGDPKARPALLTALEDAEPLVQGRAAEALGQIGDRADAGAIGVMVRSHVQAGALNGIEADDLTYPLSPAAEAARLGMYALVRLTSHDALASAVLDASGQPVSQWWPVAYALQRVGDPRAQPALMALAAAPGRYTAAFAIRGLGAIKAAKAAGMLRQMVAERKAPAAVLVQAVRALAALGDASAMPNLVKILSDPAAEPQLRFEAIAAFGTLATEDTVDLLLDLISDPAPWIRAPALRALARVHPDAFMTALAGLDADRDWTVRAAIAGALGTIPAERSMPRLTAMLQDRDVRVMPAVLTALAATRAPGAERMLTDYLRTDDFVARSAAANGLADLKAAGAVPALIEAYRGSMGDTTYVARATALAALARLDAPAARPVLQEALQDREWAVRLRAAALLREQGVAVSDTAIRPAAPPHPVDDPEWQALVAPRFSPHAFIETDKGTFEIQLAILDAPLTVRSFMTLARKGFFNGLAVHRVVPDFVVQDGDPRGDGEGGPGYALRDEINQRPYLRGTVGMALDWEDTGGSQFFVTHSPQPHLDARYTVFGTVVNGMDVVDRIVPSDVVKSVTIWDGVSPR
jgi:HEAT repeat protein/cyclophilin family peptidyl-prolyl cis-trans isomerase